MFCCSTCVRVKVINGGGGLGNNACILSVILSVLYRLVTVVPSVAAPTQLASIQELTVAMGPVMTDSLVTRRVREQREFVPQLLLL